MKNGLTKQFILFVFALIVTLGCASALALAGTVSQQLSNAKESAEALPERNASVAEAPANAKAYVVKSTDATSGNVTLTFQYGNQPSGTQDTDWWEIAVEYTSAAPWNYSEAKKVIIDDSFVNYEPTSTAYWFASLGSLATIDGFANLNTNNVINMGSMFNGCSSLTSESLVATFNTSHVTNMNRMFSSCSSLISIPFLSTFDTSSVEDMGNMFYRCAQLSSLSFSNSFKTAKVKNMFNMFAGCSKLSSLNFPDTFNTSNVEDMGYMFDRCSGLTSLTFSDEAFDTSKVNSVEGHYGMEGMFNECKKLTSLTLPAKFDTAQAGKFALMFGDCEKLTSLTLPDKFVITDGAVTTYMFLGCTELSSLTVGKNFKLKAGTELQGLDSSTNPFWIADMKNAVSFDTPEATSVANFNAVLAALPADKTQTFTKATIRLTYDANGGHFGTATPAVTEAYLYGNENDKISDAEADPAFDYTPVPVRDVFIYAGYAESQTATEAATPIVFPATDTTYYAVWKAPSAYVVKSGSGANITLTFQCGDQPSGTEGTDWWQIADSYISTPDWSSSGATTVTIDESFQNYTPTSTAYWFHSLSSLATINNISYLNTTHVTDMSYMFYGCDALTSLTLPDAFDTSSVEDMTTMFGGCSALASLTLPASFDTSSVTDMYAMFGGCSALASLTLPDTFNTSSVESMTYMFQSCSALTSLTLPAAFDTSSVRDMSYMLNSCSALKTLTLGKNAQLKTGTRLPGLASSTNPFWIKDIQTAVSYNTTEADAVKNINEILSKLSDTETQTFTKATMRLTYNANGGQFGSTTPAVTNAYLYGNEDDVISQDTAPSFDYTPIPTWGSKEYLGYAATADTKAPATPKVFPAASSTYYAVWSAEKPYVVKSTDATSGDVTLTFIYSDTQPSGTKDTDWWEIAASYAGTPWSTSGAKKVVIDDSFVNYEPTSTAYWFYNLSSLTTINGLANINTNNVTDMNNMFLDCSSLTSESLVATFNTSRVVSMFQMFSGCSALTSIPCLSTFDTSSVENMSLMFSSCSNLSSLSFSESFKTANVKNMRFMFSGCSSLSSLEFPDTFNTSNVEDMSFMFDGCSSLSSLTFSDEAFDTSKVNSNEGNGGMERMFDRCEKLTSLTLPNKFDTSNCTNMSSMFYYCKKLTSLTLPAKFVTTDATDMGGMFGNCYELSSLTVGKNFKLQEGTNLPGLENSRYPFWITDMKNAVSYNTDEATSVANFNAVLAALPDGGSQTFIKATMRLTYDANGGQFGSETPSVTQEYLYGNPGDAISGTDASGKPFDETPIPNRANYNFLGYTTEYDPDTIVTPLNFPQASGATTYKASWGQSAYVVKSTSASPTTLTFTYGAQPTGTENTDWWQIQSAYSETIAPGWRLTGASTVSFDASFSAYEPSSLAYWFYSMSALTNIQGLSNVKTANASSMEAMFANSGITSLSLPASFTVKEGANLTKMFSGCSALSSLTLPKDTFKPSSTSSMTSMFEGCSALTALDLSGFTTTSDTALQNMFLGCSALTTLTLPKTFVMQTGANLPYTNASTSPFWISNMTRAVSYGTTQVEAAQNINNVLSALSDGSSQTFTKATMRLTYNANGTGASFGTDEQGKAIENAYLYGNAGDVISKTGDGAFDNTPKPTRTDWNWLGYALTSTGTEDVTPTQFPASAPATPYYAIWAQSAYMVYDGTSKTLTLSFGAAPSEGTEGTDWWQVDNTYSQSSKPGWVTSGATSVEVDDSVENTNYKPANLAWWFSDMSSLTSVNDLSKLDVTNVTDISHMFDGCSALSNFSLPDTFAASTLTSIEGLFKGCTSLTTEALPQSFTVGASTNMASLYEGCSSISSLNLSGFTTTLATSMQDMFKGLTSLEEITLPKTFQFGANSAFPFTQTATTNFWIADSSHKMGDEAAWNSYLSALSDTASPHIFTRASITLTFDAQEGQFGNTTPAVKEAYLYGVANAAITSAELPVASRVDYGFSGYAESADGTVVTITKFPASDKTYYAIYSQAAWMLYKPATSELRLSYGAKPTPATGETVWQVANDYSDQKKPEWTAYAASKCTIDDSVKNGYQPLSMAYWFSNMKAPGATIVGLSNLKTDLVTNMEGTFKDFASATPDTEAAATPLDLSSFDTKSVSNMKSMFSGCSAFEALDVSKFNTGEVLYFDGMFEYCSRLVSLDMSQFVATKATSAERMFRNCTSLTSLDLSRFVLDASVRDSALFSGVSALTTITLPKNFTFGPNTDFLFGGTSTSNFWIADIHTKMEATYSAWNTYLANLAQSKATQTFTLASRTYTLDANKGSFTIDGSSVSALSFYGNEGDSLGTVPAPTRTGWDQNGWWTAASGGSQVTPPATFGQDASVTAYAHWQRNENYAEVSFNTNGAEQTIEPVYVQKGSTVSAPTTQLTRTNAVFLWWAEDASLQNAYDFSAAVTQDITLYARFDAATDAYISVIFDANGGSFVTQQIIAVGTSPTRPAAPVRQDGAIFKRWNTNTALTNEYTFSPLTKDTVLYASYSAKPGFCMVTFDSNGGSPIAQQQVAQGTPITKPENPSYAHADFIGWYEDEDLFRPYSDWSRGVESDLTLYAKWQAQAGYFTVHFVENGGTLVDTQIVADGSYAQEPYISREHATFAGWFEDPTFLGRAFDFSVAITKDVVLYANWTAEAGYHTVRFNTNGSLDFIQTQIVADGAYATLPSPDPSRDNASFDVWCADTALEAAFAFASMPVKADVTLYARWKAADPSAYAVITYHPNGGSFVGQAIVAKGSKATAPASPTRQDATFTWWSAQKDLSASFDFANTAIEDDITLYARWTGSDAADTVAVLFNSNGGTFVPTQIVRRGESAQAPIAPVRENGAFNAWCSDTGLTEVYTFGPVQEETELYARWSAADKTAYAVVVFNANGGSFVESQIVPLGASATRPVDPSQAHATFDGWYEDTNLSVAYAFGPVSADTTVYARWKAADPTQYSIVLFDTQGGSFVNSQVVQNGARAVRPTQVPTKADATFVNWYSTANTASLYDFNGVISSDTTIYAGWKAASYTVTFDANGLRFKDGSSQKKVEVDFGAPLVAPEVVLPSDKDLAGWYTEPAGGELMPKTCVGDATYYAHTKPAYTALWMAKKGATLELSYGTHPVACDTYWEVGGPYSEANPAPWISSGATVVSIDASVSSAPSPKSMAYWFSGMKSLRTVSGLTYLPTSGTTSLASCFKGCTSLQTLDLSGLSLASVEDVSSLFSGCNALDALNLSSFDFSEKAVSTQDVFLGCDNLASLRLTSGYAKSSGASNDASYPLSSLWSAYINGEKQDGSTFDTVLGWTDYFAMHPGTSSFIKEEAITSVAFFANGGVFEDGSTYVFTSGKAGVDVLSLPVAPTNGEYEFCGWASTPDADTPDMPDALPLFGFSSVSYYAIWKASTPPTPPVSQDGWVQSEAGWQYILNGVYLNDGWHYIIDQYGEHWYYFDPDTYMAYSRWIWDDNWQGWYWVCSTGPMIENLWQWIGDAWYGFWWGGKMCQGWVWDTGLSKWFYCYNNGVMAKDQWVWDGSGWYYFTDSGAMLTGWIWMDNAWYFLDIHGKMSTGWAWDGAWYYLDSSGKMVTSKVIDGYWVNAKGTWGVWGR